MPERGSSGGFDVDERLDAELEDHVVEAVDGPRRLSTLCGEHDDLLFVGDMGRTCAYCTLRADGFVGLLPHLTRRATFALLTPDAPEAQRAFAASRGWPFVMVSDPGRAAFGPGDDFCAVWPLFDLLEGGVDGWAPRI